MKKPSNYRIEDTTLAGDEHLFGKVLNESKYKVDGDYKYFPTNFLVQFLYDIILCIVKVVIAIWSYMFYGMRVEGRRHLKAIKGKGCISISNHVNIIDTIMVGSVPFAMRRMYAPTISQNFDVPIAKHLIRAIGAMPIPVSGLGAQKNFVSAVGSTLSKGNVVHFMPEGSLWSYYNRLRPFKNGAFYFAVKNDVPVLPIVFTFRSAKGIRRLLGKELLITMTILPAIFPSDYQAQSDTQCINIIKGLSHELMSKIIEEKGSVNDLDLESAYEKYKETHNYDKI